MLMVWPRLLELFRGGIVFSMWYNGGKLSYRESLSLCDGTLCLPLLFIAHGAVNRLLLLHPSFVMNCITICSKWQEWGSMDLNLCVMNQEKKNVLFYFGFLSYIVLTMENWLALAVNTGATEGLLITSVFSRMCAHIHIHALTQES